MHTLGFMGLPGHTEVILIIFVILLLFGAKKLPELSRSLGKSLGEFKKGQKEVIIHCGKQYRYVVDSGKECLRK